MFYHARITLKPERARDAATLAYELDMTRSDLVNRIARPFVENRQFMCGGVIVSPPRVQELRFNETQQSSSELAPFINARRRSHNIVSFGPPEREVIWEGKDITRELMDEMNRPAPNHDQAKAKTPSDRVFVVHGHDERAVDQTELLIRRFGLTPIIEVDPSLVDCSGSRCSAL